MGLFINKDDHPEVYKNKGNIKEPNQSQFKVDYFAEMINHQKEVNQSLLNSFHHLNSLYQQQENKQITQWNQIGEQLHELKEFQSENESFNQKALDWLSLLQQDQKNLSEKLSDEENTSHDIIGEINTLRESIEEYQLENEKVASQLQELSEQNQQVTEHISNHEQQQKQMDQRLENQEALMEKTLRQMNHFRSIIFERTNDLAEKIEENYNKTSTYVYELLTGSNLLMLKNKKDESQKSSK
ncbi:hypothetical protein [Aquibacillus albus]|uniref:Chromosome segregation ATPase n=1 Tax=Aquibacillus albus TaxID=1168171 RepID=A0ABS2MZK6_9BACI|nr:hypothetical protein [Aquibacillus albus]MBM7571223.1 chromosome segregation ATPase [Aquibacillus albus]